MKLYLQFGWGMMRHCISLISNWGGGTVILSPRDLKDNQLKKLSSQITGLTNGFVLLDPQFYLPHADHHRLISHNYWVNGYSTGTFFAGSQLKEALYNLGILNDELNTSEIILPGILARQITDDWLNAQLMIYQEALNSSFNRPLCQTIALSSDACRDDIQIGKLLEHCAKYPAESYYLVFEHPNSNYIVDDATWLANVLDVAAGLKLNGARVIIGYCSHQMIIASTVKVDAIASGTWMNVRSFSTSKFEQSLEDEIKQKAIWYYSPKTFSEYKLPFLDIARKLGVLENLASINSSASILALFSGGQPTTVGLSEPDAFQHYLNMLRIQTESSVKSSFDETIQSYETILSEAETLLKFLRGKGISGQLRDFAGAVDSNRAALEVIKATRGPLLRRNWSKL
jgi:hypothetical protein